MSYNKSATIVFFSILAAIFLSSTVFGVGSGSGGTAGTPCTQDFFKCRDWSACQSDGKKTRECVILTECPNVETPMPAREIECTFDPTALRTLKCGDSQSLNERVNCRLKLPKTELNKELSIQYLPEECRALGTDGEKEECVKTYANSQPCWSKPVGEMRQACLKRLFNVNDIRVQKTNCGTDTECVNSLRRNVHSLIKFRLYDLEERAEAMLEKGKITQEQATEIVSQLEQKKAEYNSAQTKEQKKQVLIDAKALWKNFIAKIRSTQAGSGQA